MGQLLIGLLEGSRVTALTDTGSSFLELSALAGEGVYAGEDVPAGGIITGVGKVQGVDCVIVANDSTWVNERFSLRCCLQESQG